MMRFFNLLLALTLLSCGVAWATTYDSQGRTYVLDPNCALYCGTLASVGNTASSVPAAAGYVGVNVGGNLVGLAPGTAGSASSQVFSVQGIASMTPLLIGNSQGSTTSGQSGPLVQGAVTTSAPSYTTAQTSPISLTTAGGLRSDVASVAGTTVLTGNGTAGSGAQRVTIASDNSAVSGFGVGATGSAPPANASYLGANSSGATGGQLAGLKSCDSSAKYDASTSGSTQIIAGVSGRKVYFCGILFATGGTATNVKLVEGTGTNCATSPADVTPAYQLAANDARGFMSPFWTGLVTATNANNVCINASAANAVQAQVFYTIQ